VDYSAELKVYRLWKPDNKIIVKAHDIKTFEDTDCQDELSKKTFYVPYLNIDDIETKDNHDSSTEDDGEEVDEGDAESSDPDEEMIIQTRSRGKSRPALLKTGKPDRPKKIYQSDKTAHQDPKSLHEIMERIDAEL